MGALSVAFGKAIPVYSRASGDGAPRESGVPPKDLVSRSALQVSEVIEHMVVLAVLVTPSALAGGL